MATPSPSPSSRNRLRYLLLAITAGVAVLVVLAALRRGAPPKPAEPIGARLELAAGDVSIGDGKTMTTAVSGSPVAEGAHVVSGKGARALVRTSDGATLFLRGDTEVVIGPKAVELTRGEVFVDAPKTDDVPAVFKAKGHQITAAEAGVSVRLAGDDVAVYVARGLAILASPGGRVEVNAGEEASAGASGAPTVKPVAFWSDWTGGLGDQRPQRGAIGSGNGRIYGIDAGDGRPGAPARKLGVAKQVVSAVLRDGVAETEVDQTFSNPGGRAIEGYYWFTVPPSAIVTSFALETNGQLVEGEVIERKEAAARYEAAKRRANDPAILEWVDGRSYRARIFPIPASGTRRVVLRYMEMLPSLEGKQRYVYPMRSDDGVRFDEFSLSVDLGDAGKTGSLATSLDAKIEDGGRRVTMRRSGYVPRADFQLELAATDKRPLRVWRFDAGKDQADYVMLRYAPDVDFDKLPKAKGEVVLVVDTSAGGDESARALRVSAAEAALRALADDDQFALVALDLKPVVVYPDKGLAPAKEGEIAKALERLSDHQVGGASDLGAMFEPALERLHRAEQPAIVYVGDGLPTSGETAPEALVERLRRSFTGSRARFFAMAVGVDANHALLGELTRAGAGQVTRVDEPDQVTATALRLTSLIKTPALTDLDVDLGAGLDQPFSSATGKVSRGEEVVLLARTHHDLPDRVKIKYRVAGKEQVELHKLALESNVVTHLVPRFWAAEYTRRLLGGATEDESRSKVLDLGLTYGLVTPYSSILALDSEAAYARDGIPRRSSKLRGVRLTELTPRREAELDGMALPAPDELAFGCTRREAAPASERAEDVEGLKEAAPKSEAPPGGKPAAVAATVAESDGKPSRESAQDVLAGETQDTRGGGGLGVMAGGGAAGPKGAAGPLGAAATPPPAPPPVVRKDVTDPRGVAAARAKKESEAANASADEVGKPAMPTHPAWVVARRPLGTCSDAASRPLAERVVFWRKRLLQAKTARDLLIQYEAARAGCELPDWRDQAALLDLLQRRVDTEDGAEAVVAHFRGEPEAKDFVSRAILRRTVDLRIAAAVARALYGGAVDWPKLDRELLDAKPEDRVKKVREAMLRAPGDPSGDVRLVRELVRAGELPEALSYGRRLRDRGLMTPTLAQQLGDVLVEAKQPEEAQRTYSEVVEFDGASPSSRRLLGDIFLRNGWFDASYRQYKTLTDLDAKAPTAWLRLASAAAGAGRIDEALRIERQVATGEGTPGPNDPRQWAKLWSAARLGRLLEKPEAAGTTAEAISRKLKELSLTSGPAVLVLATWSDLDARLVLAPTDVKGDALVGDPTDAGAVGLYALLLSEDRFAKVPLSIGWRGDSLRPVDAAVVVLTTDGRTFKATTKAVTLGTTAPRVSL